MAELAKGVKVGIVAGIVFGGAITFLVTALYAFSETANITLVIQISTADVTLFAALFFTMWMVGGMLLGVIYAASYQRLPGLNSILKGILLTMFVWLLIEIVTGFFYVPVLGVALTNIRGLISHAWSIVLNFLLALVGGVMIGALWDEFSK